MAPSLQQRGQFADCIAALYERYVQGDTTVLTNLESLLSTPDVVVMPRTALRSLSAGEDPTPYQRAGQTKTARTRARILDAARELLVIRPPAEITASVIAQSCGLSTATVYNYFPTPSIERIQEELQASSP